MKLTHTILILLFALNCFSQGSGITIATRSAISTNTVTVDEQARTFTQVYSGRQYLRLLMWSGFSNIYGHSYFQILQQIGAGDLPDIVWQRKGIPVGRTALLEEMEISGYCNTADVFDLEIAILCISNVDGGGTGEVVTHWSKKQILFSNSSTLNRVSTIEINETCPKGSRVTVAMRKLNGNNTLRYFYFSSFLNFSYQ